MFKTIRDRMPLILWPAVMGIMLAVGTILPTLYAMSLTASGMAVFACLFTVLVCVAATEGAKAHPILAKGAGALILFLFCAVTGVLGMLGGIIRMLFSALGGNTESAQAYAGGIAILLGVIVTATAYNLSRQGAGFFPAASLVLVVFMLVWFSGKREGLWLFLPALVAVCTLFIKMVNEETSNEKALLAALITVLIAFAITPILSFSSERLEKFANTLRSYLTDTFFAPEERNVYSLEVDGFMPLAQQDVDGSDKRLGGPVDMLDRPVMMVETPKRLYLRGTIHDYYSGLKWEKTLSSGRYRYSDPRNRNVRTDVLDRNRPSQALQGKSIFETMRVYVTMQSTSASSLFLPLRFDDLETAMDSILYFGVSSEMHIERDLDVGDSYSFVVPDINPYDDELPEVLAYAASEEKNRDMGVYLQLPDVISQDVYILTHNVVAGKITPIEKARAIQIYLLNNFKYTLQPETPPRFDFVSYFLLSGKEGYCTYFASAMAVMGRIAGLPTRYVEGYVAHPVNGLALVSSKNAHAWAEVYFDGFGWITFDATPADGGGGNGEKPPEEEPPESPEDQEPETQDDSQASDQEDESVPEGEDSQTEQNDSGQQNENDPQNQEDQNPEEPEQESPTDTMDPAGKSANWWKWLIVFLLVMAILVRWIYTRIDTIVFMHCRNDKERLLAWYKGILCMLSVDGKAIKPHETPVAYAARVAGLLPEHCAQKLQEVSDAVTHAGYGRFGTGAAQVIEAKGCYQLVWRKTSLRAKALWLLKRMRSGIGNVRQVP